MDQSTISAPVKPVRRRSFGPAQTIELRVNNVTAKGGQDGTYRLEPNGIFDAMGSTLDTGHVTSGFNRGIYRFALEFDIAAVPSNALLEEATLHLSCQSPALASQSMLSGFAGDGRVTPEDFVGGQDLMRFKAPGSGTQTLDVTSFVSELMARGSTWAGFSVRQDPLLDTGRNPVTWQGPGMENAPLLTIQFKKERPKLIYLCRRLVGLV